MMNKDALKIALCTYLMSFSAITFAHYSDAWMVAYIGCAFGALGIAVVFGEGL